MCFSTSASCSGVSSDLISSHEGPAPPLDVRRYKLRSQVSFTPRNCESFSTSLLAKLSSHDTIGLLSWSRNSSLDKPLLPGSRTIDFRSDRGNTFADPTAGRYLIDVSPALIQADRPSPKIISSPTAAGTNPTNTTGSCPWARYPMIGNAVKVPAMIAPPTRQARRDVRVDWRAIRPTLYRPIKKKPAEPTGSSLPQGPNAPDSFPRGAREPAFLGRKDRRQRTSSVFLALEVEQACRRTWLSADRF